MSNEWDDQGGDGQQNPGPQFDQGQYGQQPPQNPQGQYPPQNQQGQYGQQLPQNPQGQYGQQPPQNPQGQYGQQPPQNPQGQYDQQGYYDQQPYPGQQSWSQTPLQTVTPANRSSVLGVIGLVVVVLATGALMAAAWAFGAGLADLFQNLSETGFPRDPDELMNDPRTIAYAETAVGTIGAVALSCVVGLIGWIISIVATATRRGRVFGIIGIILGVAALPLAYGAFAWVLNPVLNMLG